MAANRRFKGRHVDFVVGLLTGKYQERRRRDGTTYQAFIPKITNKYPPLGHIFSKDRRAEQDILVAERVHPPKLEINQREYKKTDAERSLLLSLKKQHKEALKKAGLNHKNRMNVTDEVFIHWRAYD